ncbi:MAG TPA: zinc ribbon domain-containing protein [archaeon]|nr:zinc ribbon domain-containing protein [archaeon]
MPKCSNCGAENEEGSVFCKHCGTKLMLTVEDDVKNAIIKRIDGLKNKDEAAVKALMDDNYSKFDDWPPYQRQESAQALQNEFSSFKVLSNYTYEMNDFKANVLGDVAVATFILHYRATLRNQPFDITSRVTAVLRKQDSAWKVVHEHFSRFPEERPWQQQQRQFGRGGGFGGRFPF